MRREVSTLHSGERLLRVQPIQAWYEAAEVRSSFYHILWMGKSGDKNMRQLQVLPPGSTPHLPPAGQCPAGYLVSFPEEMLTITGCRHFYPFVPTPGYQERKPVSATYTLSENGMLIERVILSLSREHDGFHNGDMLITGLMKVLFVSISRLFRQPETQVPENDDHRLFQRFMKLVDECGPPRKAMQDYAVALSVKKDVLNDTLRKVSGYPASHHIYEKTIRLAKHAAISSGASMKEVAYGLGFKDMAHFSKFFRNKTGMTFSEYKRAYQMM
jgi:AraC family transcriptional activator of pobA